jgi:hypothetical protein
VATIREGVNGEGGFERVTLLECVRAIVARHGMRSFNPYRLTSATLSLAALAAQQRIDASLYQTGLL